MHLCTVKIEEVVAPTIIIYKNLGWEITPAVWVRCVSYTTGSMFCLHSTALWVCWLASWKGGHSGLELTTGVHFGTPTRIMFELWSLVYKKRVYLFAANVTMSSWIGYAWFLKKFIKFFWKIIYHEALNNVDKSSNMNFMSMNFKRWHAMTCFRLLTIFTNSSRTIFGSVMSIFDAVNAKREESKTMETFQL